MPAEAPPAAAAPSAPPASASPPSAPAPKGELHVTPKAVETGPAEPPPRKGSARERLFQDLRSKASGGEEAAPSREAAEPGKAQDDQPTAAAADKGKAQPEKGKGEKPNPWKMYEEAKGKMTEMEKRLSELSKYESEREQLSKRLEAAEKRAKEMQDDLRFSQAEKYDPEIKAITDKYDDAWKRSLAELGELTVDDGNGQQRNVTAQDMLELVNRPLADARKLAEEIYGDFADDAMAFRKEIKGLFAEKQSKLEEIKKSGSERQKQLRENFQKRQQQLTKEVTAQWQKMNSQITTDPKIKDYFTPVEGDEEGNRRLAAGFEMADRAFSGLNPMNPRLTPEQREEIIALHSAVRNRAAGFGRLSYQYQALKTKLTQLEKELNGYRNSEPEGGSGRRTDQAGSTSARQSVMGALRQMAK